MKKKVVEFFLEWFFRIALWFRYQITVEGLENLHAKTLTKSGGVLFLPNHPAFLDPVAAMLAIYPKYPIRPLIVEYMYYSPLIHFVLGLAEMNALPVPDFEISNNTLKRRKGERVIQEVVKGLKGKDNFLIYPAGRTKSTAYESIGAASGVHRILQEAPNANVVLVRIKGFWGSRFSQALTGEKPHLFPTLLWGVKQVFKNLLFFTPRRKITVELVPAPPDFPREGSRMELNQWMERWFNQPDGLTEQEGKYPGDSLVLVPYSMWSSQLPKVRTEKEGGPEKSSFDLSQVPDSIREKVIDKIAAMAQCPPSSVRPEMSLNNDLGMDSLDAAELSVYLHDQYGLSVPVKELTRVDRVLGIASKQIPCKEAILDEVKDMSKWAMPIAKERTALPPGDTIPEVLIRRCKASGNRAACADLRSGILSYNDLLVRSITLARHMRKMPGKNIGILLPASTAAAVCIFAAQLAGKVPVMVNWTVGTRHLESVVKLADPQVILSSWSFIDRLEGVDLSPIEERIILLEDMRRDIGFWDKVRAYFTSKRSVKHILDALYPEKKQASDLAVILFTSGTESMPKGVPLTHANLLSNQRANASDVAFYSDDALLSILPPFHAYGFSVCCIFPILTGVRVAFYPDPNDGKALASSFERFCATIMCGTPTFIKGMLKNAQEGQLERMRLCVSGAEKAPPELFEMLRKMGKEKTVMEGYGITECSPVLTVTPLGRPRKGVGKPLQNVELLIVHPETHQLEPPNQQGLILARGPNIFSGYLNEGLEAPFIPVNGKMWYRTGDLGYLDEEGNLTITGRLKRFIKVGPEMISLSAIEEALLQIAPKKGWPISQEGPSLAVCAKEIPGEKPKIYLFTKFPVDEINRTIREAGFSNLVRITAVHEVEDIPIMGTGKVNYRMLEQRYLY
jgi:long-chain-fatty-acid--[acyl-carrier-protein] ligase